MKVIIVGAGIVGANLAYRLTSMGHKVEVVDQSTAGCGASSKSFAWVNSNDRQTFEYHQLCNTGMDDYESLKKELDIAPWIHRCGGLEVASDSKSMEILERRVERLLGWGYPAQIITVKEISKLEPALRTGTTFVGGASFPSEGYVDVLPLIGTLLNAVVIAGGKMHFNSQVKECMKDGDAVTGVMLATGKKLFADCTVLCCGIDVSALLRELEVDLPMDRKRKPGYLMTVGASAVAPTKVVRANGLNIRPDGGGRIMLQAEELDLHGDEISRSLPDKIQEMIIERARAVLAPHWTPGSVERVTMAVRPIPWDGMPVVGRIQALDGLYVISTHSGVTLASALARYAGIELTSGQSVTALAPYRLNRHRPAA